MRLHNVLPNEEYPALYRGKQALVAGDAMQLKPGDLYQTRWQEIDETDPDTEIDSLA
jgi:superfamily I DNA and/or RNA helicase